ncbi:MAG TPA: glycosyltransferase family 39 protein [Anaerolineales bacterium]|nr:glycosyltransferase family 39 protein [Anaerolineales bacterium]
MNNFLKLHLRKIQFALLLLIVSLPSRFINIDRAVNIDEPWWVISSSNFYYAVTHRDFKDTYFEYHPGVTNMWVISTAMHMYFPEYRGYGQGFFDQRKPFFEEFLREHGKETLDLVRNARYIQAVILTLLALIAFFLLSFLVGENAAFLSIALAVISPFFLGHSHLLNMESMGALFVLVSLLGMHVYLSQDRKWFFLVLSGGAFGLAQLNKSTSIALLGVISLMLLFQLLKRDNRTFGAKFGGVIRIFGIWFGVAALVYFVFWPGMWVDPARMLREVYGNAFSYAFQGARLDVTEELDPAEFSLVTRGEGVFMYLRYWASGTTFLTWLGILLSAFFLFSKEKERMPAVVKSLIGYLALLGVSFILMFGIAQGRNHAHYIMNTFVAFDVIAGIGWGSALLWVGARWKGLASTTASVVVLVVITLAQIGFGLPYAPYYFTYKNPFAKEAATYGYGEGFSEAADYLAQKPNAKELTAYVYNGMGTFSYFFPGKTVVLKRANVLYGDFVTITDELRSSDYLVLYPIVREKQPETEKIFSELEGVVKPEKVIYINGLEYIQIYKVTDIPETVYEKLLAKNEP